MESSAVAIETAVKGHSGRWVAFWALTDTDKYTSLCYVYGLEETPFVYETNLYGCQNLPKKCVAVL